MSLISILASGVYQFDVYMMGLSSTDYFQIMKGESILCRGYTYSGGGTSPCSVNVQLEAGDQVYVKADGLYNGYYCGFSGFIVKAL